MLTADYLRDKFDAGLLWSDYLATDVAKAERWHPIYDRCELTSEQRSLLEGFTRDMRVLISSGLWCGDCVHQCPLLQRIAEANPDRIHLRFVDRDEHKDLAERIMINAGLRVPTVIFMAEDYEFVGLMGDRTLSRYRAVAARQIGAACLLPGAALPADEMATCLAEWINEFERIQWLLRLSPRLRELHHD